eukprot:5612575-Pleurochrysis_carterae.AAC.2
MFYFRSGFPPLESSVFVVGATVSLARAWSSELGLARPSALSARFRIVVACLWPAAGVRAQSDLKLFRAFSGSFCPQAVIGECPVVLVADSGGVAQARQSDDWASLRR